MLVDSSDSCIVLFFTLHLHIGFRYVPFSISILHCMASDSRHNNSLWHYKTMSDYVTRGEFKELKKLITAMSGEFNWISRHMMDKSESSRQHEWRDIDPTKGLDFNRWGWSQRKEFERLFATAEEMEGEVVFIIIVRRGIWLRSEWWRRAYIRV